MRTNKSIGFLATGIALASASAVPPTIHVSWSEPGPPPILDQDYRVITASPASPDYPNVELIAGSLTWRIWSTDEDNPGGIGDIGEISCPHPQNFGVAILGPSDTAGARNVKVIRLVPSSLGKYSNLTGHSYIGSILAGQLIDELTVQADSSAAGGEVALSIGGALSANVHIARLNRLSAGNVVSGTVHIDEVIEWNSSDITGSVSIGIAKAPGPTVRVLGAILGSLSVFEIESNAEFVLFANGDVSESGTITFGDIHGTAEMDIGSYPAIRELSGAVRFLTGIPTGTTVRVWNEVTSTGTIDLNGANVTGVLNLVGGGNGSIVNGGTLNGSLRLGREEDGDGPFTTFSGIASFGALATGSVIASDLPGTIHFNGSADGSIVSTGEITGQVIINGDFTGDICATNISPGGSLPPHI